MHPEHELRNVVQQYIAGSIGLIELREWLEDHVIDLYEGEDGSSPALANLAWLLIGEYDRGDRDDRGVKAELAVELAPRFVASEYMVVTAGLSSSSRWNVVEYMEGVVADRVSVAAPTWWPGPKHSI